LMTHAVSVIQRPERVAAGASLLPNGEEGGRKMGITN
jgi:hypothetical protein